MNNSIKIGRLFGISIELHYSWFIIFGLLVWSLSSGYFPGGHPGWSAEMNWLVGGITTILFFLSVLIHEFAHSLLAKSQGMTVDSITLFIIGGVSNLKQEPRTAGTEFAVAIVGPLSSLILAIGFGIVWLATGSLDLPIAAIASYLAVINFMLAIFNLIPGFPLDGGRVLRALIWMINDNFVGATHIATRVGRWIGYALIFGGLLYAVGGNWVSGLWFLFIGWFLSNAAESAFKQTVLDDILKGVPVTRLMTREFENVGPELTLSALVHDHVLQHSWRAFPVVSNGNLLGLISMSDLKKLPREQWDRATVREVMTPAERLLSAKPNDDALAALHSLGSHNVNQLPVLDEGQVIGFVNRGSVLSFIQMRQDLGV